MAVRILVIDDDDDDVEMIDRALSEHGYIALIARSGDEPMRIAEIQQPDLLLLDIHMPAMNGFEVAASVRRQPGLERTRIVAVTGSWIEDQSELQSAGFDGYIRKPIDPGSFLSQIEAFLDAPLAEPREH